MSPDTKTQTKGGGANSITREGEKAQHRVDVRPLFATPIVLLTLANSDDINKALEAVITGRAQSQPSTQHSNLGGWQSSWDLEDWGGAPAKTVLDTARGLASRVTSDRQGKAAHVDWKTNAWANVNRSGEANEFHTHPGAFWSGTYYVNDGGIGQDSSLGGEFEIQDPRGVAPAMYAPQLTIATPGGASMGASEILVPRAGLMVLFPSWLSHAVRPYRGDKVRISIAFNFSL